jgi:hypothetical protein
MQIDRNKSIEEWAISEIVNNWGKDTREGIHLTDLLTPRKKYWGIVKPLKATIEEISYFTSGSAIEYRILSAMGYKKGETKEWNGIKYSVDSFMGNIPAEIKTRRRLLAEEGKEAEVYEHYLNQLKGYCAIEDKPKGWLIVLSLLEKQEDKNKTAPEWAFYDVMFTPVELEEERGRLLRIKREIEEALQKRDHSDLPLCPIWMCRRILKIMVKKPYCKNCSREFETEWGINKHVQSRSGQGHEIVMPEYEEKIEKICKWYDDCQ